MDRLGTRLGFTISLVVWSLAAAAHAFAGNVTQFMIARFALGLGESGNFPAAIKTVAEWFPKRERALATGIFNAGTNVGATISPFIVPIIYQVPRLGSGVHGNGARRAGMGRLLVADVSAPARASQGVAAGAGIHRKRSGRSAGAHPLGNFADSPSNLGFCHREVSHRFDLVVLPVLVRPVHGGTVRRRHQDDRCAHDDRVPDGRYRLGAGRLAELVVDWPGLVGKFRPQNGDADLCLVHRAGGARRR